MAIYVIADLHLSFNTQKPMDIFGDNWLNHEEKIKIDWQRKVKSKDTVIIPGDFSWATYINDAKLDFEYLNNLPGKKIILKGNHDYWWTTVTSMNRYLKENNFETISFLYNNSYCIENKIIVGTRGWSLKENSENTKMINRELLRLELSIKDGISKYGEDKEIMVFMHYPPIAKSLIDNKEKIMFIELMNKYNIKKCFYGHLHGESQNDAIEGEYKGINLKLISADYLNFELYKI